ncbi:cellulase family glycosylhydrolase [Rathayibacter sp. VKM Ac-2760]|uniref:cellulase family glycosylhydrolase n=1 Tax=Rathayibacter sp. VKM Ac-2760 TaxID=2609253 RepID=UPI0013183C05|nr:cellulase family glycosylhydrolase [Rathayibacter sp. VKM Ac-2760]QHC57211.1 cellulase family glycosylhydrolase [Rathayibacter sp. VKM Ac-2760]
MSRARTVLALSIALIAGTLVVPAWAVADPAPTTQVDGFERADPGLSAVTGTVQATASADSSEGGSALAVDYDVTAGLAELAYDPVDAPVVPTPVTALTVDLQGDGSYNTVYLRVRDASGETFVHRIDAMRATDYQTLTVDLTAEPAAREGGNADGILDAPLTLAGVLVVRNGEQPPTGAFVLDDVRAVTTGWSLPVAAAPFVSPQAGEQASFSFEAATAGDWELRLTGADGRSRLLSGTAASAGTTTVDWDGEDDQGAAMSGEVRGVFRQDSTADGVLGAGSTTGIPLLVTLAGADDAALTDLVESFDAGPDGWGVASGSAVLRRATATGPAAAARTQGSDALAVDYDLGAGMTEISRTAPLTAADGPVTGLKVDLRGDGSYNTVYVRLADATGEVFTYRLDAMRHSTWATIPVDLTQDPVLAEGGDADSVLDLPLTLAGFSVVRNGQQPATGTFLLDNLRVVSSRWTLPVSDTEFLEPGAEATLGFTAAGGGDWRIELRDGQGRARDLTGTATAAGDVSAVFDGTAGDGTAMQGPISSTFLQDSTPDGTIDQPRTRSATPILLTAAAADPITATLVEGFETAASGWRVALGSGTVSTTTQRTEGAQAQRIDYDLSNGLLETVQGTPATVLTAPARGLRIDLRGDASYNTVYARLHDATGETYTYRLDAMRSTSWATVDVDLTGAPAAVEGGDGNQVLDLPVTLSGFLVVRNGNQPAVGSVTLDNLRVLTSGWSMPVSSTDFFTPASSETMTVDFTASGPGDYELRLGDADGRTRTVTGEAAAAGPVSVPLDGSDDAGAMMRGDIDAVFAHDDSADGTMAANPARSGTAVLLTVADTDSDAAVAESFDTGGADWVRAAGTVTPTTSTTRTEGSGALKLSYDLTRGDAETEAKTTPEALLTQPASALKLDVLGDGSWNTVFLKLRDATGEMFLYRVDALSLSRWTTATIDLRAPAADTHLGNEDGVLDYPVSLVRVNIVRNGASAPATGSVTLDNLRIVDKDWTLPTASSERFSRENAATTTVRFSAGAPGDYALTLADNGGRTRSYTGTARAAGPVSVVWDGTDGSGAGMAGSVSARLAWDSTPDGALTGAATAAQPYLTGVSAKATEASPTSISGINSFLTEQDSPVEADRQAALLEDASVRWAREEFEWKRIEPRRGFYDWAKFDQAVAISRARNVDMIGKLAYSAPWASSAPAGTAADVAQYYPPSDTAAFAAYAAATVERYKDRVHVWEVWNEPNTDYYWRGGTAQQYGALLKAAYTAIKAADPTATVLVGGLDQFSDPFMQGVLDAGAGDSYDGLAIHTYAVSGAPEVSAIPTYLDAAEAFLARTSPERSLWITEVSWATCGSCAHATSEADQAAFLSRSYLDAAARGIRAIAWYNLVGGSDQENFLDTYAVTEKSGRLKPAYTALKDVGAILAEGTAVGRAGATAASAPVRADDFGTLSKFAVAPIGGGSATLATTSTNYSGAASLKLDYAFSGSSKGAQIQTSRPLTGSPTAVSVWVNGDASASPVYLKITDATGETFQGLVGNAGAPGWEKMTLFSDGLNPNYSHSGGDDDGVWDYPVKLTDMFVYKSTSGVTAGTILIDDLTADYGVNLHGTVFHTPTETIQAVYTAGPSTASMQVSGTQASVLTAGGRSALAVSDAHSSVTLGKLPTFVASGFGVSPQSGPRGSTVTLDWLTPDAAISTVVAQKANGSSVKTLASNKEYLSGRQTISWDGKLSNGTVAPAGGYLMRITTVTLDGRTVVTKVPFTLT